MAKGRSSKSKAKKARKRANKAKKKRDVAAAKAAATAAIGGGPLNKTTGSAAAQAAADSIEGGEDAARASAVDAAGRLGVTLKLGAGKVGRAEASKAAEAAISKMKGELQVGEGEESRQHLARVAADTAVMLQKIGKEAKPTFVPKTRREALNLAKFELGLREQKANRNPSGPSTQIQALDLADSSSQKQLDSKPKKDPAAIPLSRRIAADTTKETVRRRRNSI